MARTIACPRRGIPSGATTGDRAGGWVRARGGQGAAARGRSHMIFQINVFAWIPLPEVPNPIAALPGGTAMWGPGACGPHFGGDNFVRPAATAGGWTGTFRAKQTYAFRANAFGDPPMVTLNSGVVAGLTTVLTAPRASGGTVCHSLTATVKTSSASVKWSSGDDWYEAKLHGEAQDPVPAAVAGRVGGSAAGTAASALTPNLEWKLTMRFQRGSSIGLLTRAAYATHSALSLDVAATHFPAPTGFGGSGNLVHGTILVRRFPSYIVYTTIDAGSGPVCIPHYFAEASGRHLATIAIGQTDLLRKLAW